MSSIPFAENRASSEKLRALAGRLSEADLRQQLSDGWTVAAILAHIAFWDLRTLVLLRRWKEAGYSSSPIDIEAVNRAVKELCLAIEPRAAVGLCLDAAEKVDEELKTLGDELAQRIATHATNLNLNRSLHRDDHLGEIERSVQA